MLKLPKYRLVYIFPLLALIIIVTFFGIEIQMEKKIIDISMIPQTPNIESLISGLESSKKNKANQAKETFSLHNEPAEKDGYVSSTDPSLDSEGIPVAWVLRVDGPKDKQAATELSKKLLSNGYSAFIKESVVSGVVISHIYIGPKIAKDKLSKDKESLSEKYSLDSQLIKFKP
jgi:cell division septation protein DedD